MPAALPVAADPPPTWAAERAQLQARIAQLEHQLAWLQRQIFGEKSERRHLDPPPEQLSLGEGLAGPTPDPAATQPVAAHTRHRATTGGNGDETPLFFDPARVPVEAIEVPNPEVAALAPHAYEVIGDKDSHRLAQRPGSYVVLKYRRPVIKLRETPAHRVRQPRPAVSSRAAALM